RRRANEVDAVVNVRERDATSRIEQPRSLCDTNAAAHSGEPVHIAPCVVTCIREGSAAYAGTLKVAFNAKHDAIALPVVANLTATKSAIWFSRARVGPAVAAVDTSVRAVPDRRLIDRRRFGRRRIVRLVWSKIGGRCSTASRNQDCRT